jgi:hypothetical protein
MEYDIKKYESSEQVEKYTKKMSANIEELEKKFEALKNSIGSDLKEIDQTNLISEQNKNISMLHKYMTILAEEKYTYQKIKNVAAVIDGELNDYYRHHWDKSTKLTEVAITKYVQSHKCYIAINNYLKLSENINNHLENVVSIFKDRNYAIKNIIEVRKIELGL